MNILYLIILMIVGSIFNAIAPIFLKKINKEHEIVKKILNTYFVAGLLSYGLAYLITLPPLRYGEIGLMYPIMSLTYVWSYFFGVVFLKEPKSLKKILGIVIIILGIVIIA